jgi:hypothetical protein
MNNTLGMAMAGLAALKLWWWRAALMAPQRIRVVTAPKWTGNAPRR